MCKAFWGIGGRDWTIMFFLSRSAGVNASLLLYDDFKTKKSSYWNINII